MAASPNRTRHSSRWCGEVMLSLALSVGVVFFLSQVSAAGGAYHGARGILIAAPAAVIAVFLGLRLTSRMGLAGPGPAAALNKAAVVSVIFTALLIPAALLTPSARAAAAGGALAAGSGVPGQLLD